MQYQAAFADSTIHRARLTSRGKGIEYAGTKLITPRPFSVFALVLKLFLQDICCSYSILLSTASTGPSRRGCPLRSGHAAM